METKRRKAAGLLAAQGLSDKLDGAAALVRAKVGVAAGHVQRGVAQQLADDVERHPANGKPARKRVAQRVEHHAVPRIRDAVVQPADAHGPAEDRAGAVHDVAGNRAGEQQAFERAAIHAGRKDGAGKVRNVRLPRAGLGVHHVDHAAGKVDVAHAQVQDLAEAHAGGQRHGRHVVPHRRHAAQRDEQQVCLVVRKVAHAAVVHLGHGNLGRGNGTGVEVPRLRLAVDAAQRAQDVLHRLRRKAGGQQVALEGFDVEGADLGHGARGETRQQVALGKVADVRGAAQAGQVRAFVGLPRLAEGDAGAALGQGVAVAKGLQAFAADLGGLGGGVALGAPADLLPHLVPAGTLERDVVRDIRLAVPAARLALELVNPSESGLLAAHFLLPYCYPEGEKATLLHRFGAPDVTALHSASMRNISNRTAPQSGASAFTGDTYGLGSRGSLVRIQSFRPAKSMAYDKKL